jgi:hypothetical protein
MTCVTQEVAESESKQHSVATGYCKAYRTGVGNCSRWYGDPLVSEVTVHMRDGQLGRGSEACRC